MAVTFCQYTRFVSNKHQKMPNFIIFTELFAKLGYTEVSICDSRLITSDHRILNGCNTFLRGSRASSRDATAIKKAIKIFSLTCKWSIPYHMVSKINYFAFQSSIPSFVFHEFYLPIITIYAVHLTMILIWRFGKFISIHQIKCTHCLHLCVSIHDLHSPCIQTKCPPIYITYQFAKLYVHQMYLIYSTLLL